MKAAAWLLDLLYGRQPAEFQSASFGLDDSVSRLKSGTVRFSLVTSFFLTESAMVGRVTATRVVLSRVTPMVHNSFGPVFTGCFCPRDSGVVLSGHFALRMFTRVFMTIWFTFILLWTCMTAVVSLFAFRQTWFFPLFGMGMFGVGILMMRSAKWGARNDQAWLSDRISRALGGSSSPEEVRPIV